MLRRVDCDAAGKPIQSGNTDDRYSGKRGEGDEFAPGSIGASGLNRRRPMRTKRSMPEGKVERFNRFTGFNGFTGFNRFNRFNGFNGF